MFACTADVKWTSHSGVVYTCEPGCCSNTGISETLCRRQYKPNRAAWEAVVIVQTTILCVVAGKCESA